jgi:hypothetical protein
MIRVLPQAPRSAISWKWKEEGTLLSLPRPLWTDNLLAKRRREALRTSFKGLDLLIIPFILSSFFNKVDLDTLLS